MKEHESYRIISNRVTLEAGSGMPQCSNPGLDCSSPSPCKLFQSRTRLVQSGTELFHPEPVRLCPGLTCASIGLACASPEWAVPILCQDGSSPGPDCSSPGKMAKFQGRTAEGCNVADNCPVLIYNLKEVLAYTEECHSSISLHVFSQLRKTPQGPRSSHSVPKDPNSCVPVSAVLKEPLRKLARNSFLKEMKLN